MDIRTANVRQEAPRYLIFADDVVCLVCMNAEAFQRLLGLEVLEKKVEKKRDKDKQNKFNMVGTYVAKYWETEK